MNQSTSQRIAAAIEKLAELYPDWRYGQIVANVAQWAKGPNVESIWDVNDAEFLAAAEAHLRSRNVAPKKKSA